MTLGGKKPRKRVVKKTKVKKTTTRRRVGRHVGGRVVAKRKVVVRKSRHASIVKPSVRKPADRIRRSKGKPRGDVNGAKYVGKRIREESAKKGRKLTRVELSKLFKDAWAEYKARKGK